MPDSRENGHRRNHENMSLYHQTMFLLEWFLFLSETGVLWGFIFLISILFLFLFLFLPLFVLGVGWFACRCSIVLLSSTRSMQLLFTISVRVPSSTPATSLHPLHTHIHPQITAAPWHLRHHHHNHKQCHPQPKCLTWKAISSSYGPTPHANI